MINLSIILHFSFIGTFGPFLLSVVSEVTLMYLIYPTVSTKRTFLLIQLVNHSRSKMHFLESWKGSQEKSKYFLLIKWMAEEINKNMSFFEKFLLKNKSHSRVDFKLSMYVRFDLKPFNFYRKITERADRIQEFWLISDRN